MNANGSNQHPVKLSGLVQYDPVFTPDGKRIIFSGGNGDLCEMRTDGSQRRRLSDGMGYDEYPDISPNGSKLVFDRTVGMGKSGIYVARANGSNAKPLTNTSSNSFEPWFCRVGRRSPSRAIVRAPSTRDS